MLGDREAGQRDAGAGTRRFVHLAIDQRGLGAGDAAFLRFLFTPDSIIS